MVVRMNVALQLPLVLWLNMAARLLEALRLLAAVARAWRGGSGKSAAARLRECDGDGRGKQVTLTAKASNPGPQ